MDYIFGGQHQFHQPRVDPISPGIAPIELHHEAKTIGHGTGFVWQKDADFFLITNWHNFSGQNPFTGEHLSEGGAVPDKIRVHIAAIPSGQSDGIVRYPIWIPLYEHFDKPLWQQHQRFSDLRIDVVALRLPPNVQYLAINRFGDAPKLFSHVGSEVFVVGYPFPDFDHVPLQFPIWKRGSIASDVFFGWKGRPAFLIDAASRRGMSGSPVFRRIFGPAPTLENEQFIIQGSNIMTQEFIGVYSGHLFAMSSEVTIGIAWYGMLVHEMLAKPAIASRL